MRQIKEILVPASLHISIPTNKYEVADPCAPRIEHFKGHLGQFFAFLRLGDNITITFPGDNHETLAYMRGLRDALSVAIDEFTSLIGEPAPDTNPHGEPAAPPMVLDPGNGQEF